MKVYLDVIFILNFLYDFLILSSVSVLLKRHAKLSRILISSLIGSISLITLFVGFNNILLSLFKVSLSLVMVLICFGKRRFFESLFYMYIVAIVIGGSQYMLTGNYYEVNIVTFGLLSPVVVYLYIKSMNEYKISITKYYDVVIVSGSNTYKLVGYMDTGNRLKEPILGKPIIFVRDDLEILFNNIYFVPYKVINGSSILKCGSVDSVIINGEVVDCLIGLVDKYSFKDMDCLLNEYIREILND